MRIAQKIKDALVNGDIDFIEMSINNGTLDVNGKDSFGTVLSYAIRSKDANLVELLLQSGADANATEDDGDTALLAAVESGQFAIVELLLQYGADANTGEDFGPKAIDHAIKAKYYHIVDLLVKAGATASNLDSSSMEVLIAAARIGEGSALDPFADDECEADDLDEASAAHMYVVAEDHMLVVDYRHSKDTVEYYAYDYSDDESGDESDAEQLSTYLALQGVVFADSDSDF